MRWDTPQYEERPPVPVMTGEDGMDTRGILKPRMRAGSQRLTRQKIVILEALRKVTSHPSAREVCRMAQKRIPNISFGTVYRNLRQLEEFGLIQELSYGKASSRYDGTPANHYHISCTACGRVDDIPMNVRRELESEARRASRYDVKEHRIEFYGLCPKCRSGVRR